ncbi:MAG TPA: heterodisulfide reductase-related iron-sulfur binding cluster [Gemmatimonadales bacterium]|nr:heterodisulfide reductase-related iron-sulfur binding cluster [Gemmatimonadales bacterium]
MTISAPAPVSRGGFSGLDACVHCGFCLQACPTFLATGDEADGPRGRIELMRAFERGELPATDQGLAFHLDRCLGCRGCEPVCPSGVAYGDGLEEARTRLASARGTPGLARLALGALTHPVTSRLVYALARVVRDSGLAGSLAGKGRVGFAMGMLAATRADGRTGGRAVGSPGPRRADAPSARPPDRPTAVFLFRGCVMQGLFSHVHDATIRTLAVNRYDVHEVSGQVCCGALHAHAGLRDAARALARQNVAAFGAGTDPIVVNSAGCGAQMKAYGHLLDGAPDAERFAARVTDVTEVLADRGPVPGAPLELRVAYDAPCHLLHAQRIAEPPLAVLRAIPAAAVRLTADSAQCCGSAGLYSTLEPELSRAVLAPKVERILADPPDVLATANPGCVMQLGAGLRAAGARIPVRHPVELLDDSYRAAGFYT